MNHIATLDNPNLKGQENPVKRPVMLVKDMKLPRNTVVVSADSHWEIETDIFIERLPPEMRDRAPRLWLDGFMRMGVPDANGKVVDLLPASALPNATAALSLPGMYNLDVRMQHMDTEGVQKEINFPSLVLAFLHHPDFEFREAIFRVYNEYIAERGASTNGRSFGVGILSNWWDPEKAPAAVQQIKDLGLKTFMIPINPGKDRAGRPIIYSEPNMDRMWSAIEQSGLPLCFHIGESFAALDQRGGLGIASSLSLQPFLPILAMLVYGCIFDRHPGLRIVFAEGGISWALVALQDFESIYDWYPGSYDILPALRPSEYWAKHCYATFMHDRLGLENLAYLGADHVMWSVDYPHGEGSWGYSQPSMKGVLDLVSEDDARKILGGNAIKVFGL